MAARLPKKAVGVSDDGTLDPKHFIGRVVSFTHPDDHLNSADAAIAWDKHGLDLELFPETRTPTHVFQSACRSVDERTRTNGHRVEVKVDEVLNDKTECVYQITRMVRDAQERVIEHQKDMRVAFDKGTGLIQVDELEHHELIGIEERIRKHFRAHAKTVPGQKIRNAVRDTLLSIGAQNLRRKAGGLYFVPVEYLVRPGNGQAPEYAPTKPLLDGLAGFLGEVYGDRGDFYQIPLANDEGMREMVRKHFTLNVQEKLEALTLEAIDRVRSGIGKRGVRQDFRARLWNERRRVTGAIAQFEELVEAERDDMDKWLRDFDEAMGELEDLADSGGAGDDS